MAAALFIMSMGFGSLIGPLLGGSVYDHYGGNADRTLYPDQEKIVTLIFNIYIRHSEKH